MGSIAANPGCPCSGHNRFLDSYRFIKTCECLSVHVVAYAPVTTPDTTAATGMAARRQGYYCFFVFAAALSATRSAEVMSFANCQTM